MCKHAQKMFTQRRNRFIVMTEAYLYLKIIMCWNSIASFRSLSCVLYIFGMKTIFYTNNKNEEVFSSSSTVQFIVINCCLIARAALTYRTSMRNFLFVLLSFVWLHYCARQIDKT